MSISPREIVLPSGARVTLRKLKLDELDIMGNPATGKHKGVAQETVMTRVLQACTVAVVDHGPYPAFSWDRAVISDRLWGTLQLRVATRGLTLPYGVQCQDCAEVFDAPINLGTPEEGGDIDVLPVPEASRAAIKAGAHISRALCNGDTVAIRQIVAADAAMIAKITEPHKASPIKAMFLARCASVTKADGTVLSTAPAIAAYLGELDLDAVEEFAEVVNAVDGGVADEVEVTCPHCMETNEVQVTSFFSVPAFWGLNKPRKKPSRS